MGEETTKYAKHAKMGTQIVFKEESYKIIGAFFEVYKEKGNGFLEAIKLLADEHRAQVINYLKATGKQLGLLVNFGHYPKIEHERFVNQSLSRL
jgi:hypothetical protein